jgi:hypothetical protein
MLDKQLAVGAAVYVKLDYIRARVDSRLECGA